MKTLQEQYAGNISIHFMVVFALLLSATAMNNALSNDIVSLNSTKPQIISKPVIIHKVVTTKSLDRTHADAFDLEYRNYRVSASLSSKFNDLIGRR